MPPPFACQCSNLQALDKARKDLEKARKVREPLNKKLAEDPQALHTLAAEVEGLRQQLAAL
jgi:cysteinyl-tRNA synthetase